MYQKKEYKMIEIPQYPNVDTCFYVTSAGKPNIYECKPISFVFDTVTTIGTSNIVINVTFNFRNASSQCIKTLYYDNDTWQSADKQFFTDIIDAISFIEKHVTYKTEELFKNVVKTFSKKYPEILL
jgi:hypothetical protein